jgi:predicted acyltransferase
LISPKIDMDVHQGNVDFRTAQHHLDVDSLNALEVYVLPILMVSMLLKLGRGLM